MIKLQELYKEINRNVNLLNQIDLNTDREKANIVMDKLVSDITDLQQKIKSKEGKFKAIAKCIECREYGLAYDVDIHKKQIVKCKYCKSEVGVKLYKDGRLRVSSITK